MGISVVVIKEKNKPEDWRLKLKSEVEKGTKSLFEAYGCSDIEKERDLLRETINHMLDAFNIAADHINWED